MEWIIVIAVAVAAIAFVVHRILSAPPGGVPKELPSREDLEAEIRRLEEELQAATECEDDEAVEEATLQLRVKQHWLRKVEDGSWREFYRKSGAALDEWGKTGAK